MLKTPQLLIFTSLVFFPIQTLASKPPYNETVHADCSTNSTEDKLNTSSANEFNLTFNSSLFVAKYNLTLNETYYILKNITAVICKLENSVGNPCLCTVGYFAVFSSLFFQLLVVLLRQNMKRYMSCAIGMLGISSYISVINIFILEGYFMLQNGIIPCSFPALIHFYILASVSWMSMMSTDGVTAVPGLQRKFHAVIGHKLFLVHFMWIVTYLGALMTIFITFILFNVSVSLLLNELFPILHSFLPQSVDTSCCVVIDTSCMLFFVSQVVTFIIMNLASHYYDRWTYRCMLDDEKAKNLKHYRRDHMMIFTFSIIIYITYIIGALAAIPAISWMWNLFIFLLVSEMCCIFFSALITIMFNLSMPDYVHPAYDILLNFAVVGKLFWKWLSCTLKEFLREEITAMHQEKDKQTDGVIMISVVN